VQFVVLSGKHDPSRLKIKTPKIGACEANARSTSNDGWGLQADGIDESWFCDGLIFGVCFS